MAKGETLGSRLAQERREKAVRDREDIDRSVVAKAIGVSPSTYSRYEADLTKPPDDVLGLLARYYGTTRAYLRFGEGERYPLSERATVPLPRPPKAVSSQVAPRKHRGGR